MKEHIIVSENPIILFLCEDRRQVSREFPCLDQMLPEQPPDSPMRCHVYTFGQQSRPRGMQDGVIGP